MIYVHIPRKRCQVLGNGPLPEPEAELKKGFNLTAETLVISGGPGRDRTLDQLIKSQLLYQLSYWPMIY